MPRDQSSSNQAELNSLIQKIREGGEIEPTYLQSIKIEDDKGLFNCLVEVIIHMKSQENYQDVFSQLIKYQIVKE